MNARFGWGLGGIGIAAVFVAIALFGALCGVMYRRTGGDRGMSALFLICAIGCFAMSQVAGNAVTYTAFADGGLGRQVKATSGATARDDLKRLRDEAAKVGTQRPVDTVQAQEKLECSRTSPSYKDGVGPKCTELRAELGLAKRAAALPGEIAKAAKAATGAPVVTDGEPYLEQLQWIISFVVDLELPGLRRGWVVALVFVLGLIANFGPAMLLGGSRGGDGGRRGWHDDNVGAPEGGNGGHHHARAFVPPAPLFAPVRQIAGPPKLRQIAQHAVDVVADAMTPGAAFAGAQHGAPVIINMAPAAAPMSAASQPPASAPLAAPIKTEPPHRAPDDGIGIRPDTAPVDRRPMNAITDNLLAFKSACLVDVSGSHVTATDLYRRYLAWRGAGALGEAAFTALFADVAGVERSAVGDQLHYRGVALRAPALAAVG